MRTLFLLFVLANFGFFAWDRYLRAPVGADTHIQQVQMSPEKIRLVNAAAPPAKSAPAATAAACMEWGAFSGAAVARADAAMVELDLPASQFRRVTVEASGYWVYIPPLKSRNEAEKSARALRELGVTDYSVVQEQTPWRNAISLGIFRTDEAAKAFLASLEKKGVAGAVAEKRENFLRQVVFYVREPSETTVAKLAAIRATLPASEVRAVPCPA
ncbi:MAG: SPOR domain-containing protein [Burkholderiales bacterium]